MKKMNRQKIYSYIAGSLFFLTGIYLSVYKKEPHFYTLFSIGALIIFVNIYNSITKKDLFKNKKELLFFSVILLMECIIIDNIGMYLGYWGYQYSGFFDNFLKYVFEWAVPLVYSMVLLMIGKEIFNKKFKKNLSFILSLLIFITLFGLFTEYINLFSDSWIILNMPITNYKIGGFFIIFQTIGYWLIALIPWITYKIIRKANLDF